MKAQELIDRLSAYYGGNERAVAAVFFAAGFVFDMLTLGRIDSWLMIGQQAVYLTVILLALVHLFLEQASPAVAPAGMSAVRRGYFRYRTAIVHFLLGALLNMYAIFFFKSASLLTSFAFLGFLVLLVLANESPRFKSLGLSFKFALLSLCFLSFFACVIPVLVGSIGLLTFLLSMAVGCLPLLAAAVWVRRFAPDLFPHARKQILIPLGSVLVAFLASYLFRLIPPVPLSIPFIGVYHAVERSGDSFRLSHQRPRWRVWHNGDQSFLAQPGDKVYVFFRVFSPTRFSDEVLMRWYWKDGARGWVLQDAIRIRIVGGRQEGFRGYGVKANYQPGHWKVQIETIDEREIGRVYFDLQTVPAAPRTFELDLS
ncbi:MAG: DUF2914 domain-containing protein [Pseudomonadota bacterium]|nr:DUF2914 domain-containing protein [Pseudomonadota bacterium]